MQSQTTPDQAPHHTLSHPTPATLAPYTLQGDGLESRLACPAWDPVLSLESVDGPLWRELRDDFNAMMRVVPPPAKLQVPHVLCCAVPCCAVLRHAGLCCAVPCRAVLCCAHCLLACFPCWHPPCLRPRAPHCLLLDPALLPPPLLSHASHTTCSTSSSVHPLQASATSHLDALLASGQVIDADAVVRWSAATFIDYLFDIHEWRPEFEVFVAASWEWRRQIAVRGAADPEMKAAAVRCLTETLLPASPSLWALHGEAWREPRYYSLIMQPFLISPCINLSDIAVALAAAPGASHDQAVRLMHPFPILERLVHAPVLHPATGQVAVPAGAHAIMFTADFAHAPPPFPIFGAGPRACPGGPLVTPVLALMREKLVGCPRFQPLLGHTSSGRHNDANWSLAETLYFAKTVLPLLK